MLDMFSGGALRRFSVAAMGVYPYITATIIMTILVPVIPQLQALSMEGESGRNKINTDFSLADHPSGRSGSLRPVDLFKKPGCSTPAIRRCCHGDHDYFHDRRYIFLIWLGELITEHGIGNGISIIIFGGIVAGYPQTVGQAGLLGSQQYHRCSSLCPYRTGDRSLDCLLYRSAPPNSGPICQERFPRRTNV